MMQNTSFDNGVQVVWDATSIELAQTCPRKYYYAMVANIEPTRKSVHLLFGGFYASALELFYKERALGATIEDALRLVIRHTLIDTWDDEAGEALRFDHSAKTRENLIRTIIWYVDEFGNEDESSIQTHHLSDGSPAVELSFKVELSEDIVLAGHLDRVVEYGAGLYWMDQKTTSGTIGAYYFDQFKPHNQFMNYTWSGQTVLKSPVKGGIIDAAQIAVGFSRFERRPITFTNDQLDEWADNTLWTIKHMQSLASLDKYPMNLSACGNYGGCPFRPLCARSPGLRANFLEGDFVKRAEPWDPNKAR